MSEESRAAALQFDTSRRNIDDTQRVNEGMQIIDAEICKDMH